MSSFLLMFILFMHDVSAERLNNATVSYFYNSANQMIHLMVLAQSYRIYTYIEPVALCFFSIMGIFMILSNKVK